MSEKIVKTEAEWRAQLTDEQFRVCRNKGTERAFSGALWETKANGDYHCVCCGQRLFSSATKFDSGTGWPSFWAPATDAGVATKSDNSVFMRRTEVICSQCESHLGHVFEDGPEPSGLRYCVNSAALEFHDDSSKAEKEE